MFLEVTQKLLATIFTWVLWSSCMHNTFIPKIARNMTSISHATLVVLGYLCGVSGDGMFYISFSYYFVDLVLEIQQFIEHKKLSGFGLILHHVVSCYVLQYLNDDVVMPYLYYSFFVIELSNFPVYLTYHIKISGFIDNTILKYSIYLEIIAFAILRLCVSNYNFYLSCVSGVVPLDALVCAGSICVISFIWFVGFVIQVVNMNGKHKTD